MAPASSNFDDRSPRAIINTSQRAAVRDLFASARDGSPLGAEADADTRDGRKRGASVTPTMDGALVLAPRVAVNSAEPSDDEDEDYEGTGKLTTNVNVAGKSERGNGGGHDGGVVGDLMERDGSVGDKHYSEGDDGGERKGDGEGGGGAGTAKAKAARQSPRMRSRTSSDNDDGVIQIQTYGRSSSFVQIPHSESFVMAVNSLDGLLGNGGSDADGKSEKVRSHEASGKSFMESLNYDFHSKALATANSNVASRVGHAKFLQRQAFRLVCFQVRGCHCRRDVTSLLTHDLQA